MTFQPRIFTFYSYKGGVGRSMALLNVAYYLHARGRHVLIVDLDLDAPGASGFLRRTNELSHQQDTGDVVDVLAAVIRCVKATAPGAEPNPPSLRLEAFLREVDPRRYAPPVHPRAPRARLDVLAADETRDYTARLSALELANLSAQQIADASDLLRSVLLQHRFRVPQPWEENSAISGNAPYDYILVDSRTGLSEIGGLCVGPLSDRLIVLCGLNDQNINGTRHFLEIIGLELKARSADAMAWDDADPSETTALRPATLGPKPTLLVASPVPGGEMTYKRERMKVLESKIGLSPVKLSYHPQMALIETLFVRDYPDEYLALEYATLANRVMGMVGDTNEQLREPIARLFEARRTEEQTETGIVDLPQRLTRMALASGQFEFEIPVAMLKHYGVSPQVSDQIRWLRIHLAPTDEQEAQAWLSWADELDTEEARQAGDSAVFRSMEEKYRKAVSLKRDFHQAFYNWGVALSSWAAKKEGAEADALFAQAGEKYQQALEIKPDKHEALNNWGFALSSWAEKKEGSEADALFAQAGEKYQQALEIKPDKHEALNNWGNALLAWAKKKGGAEADALFAQASEKYQQALTIKPDKHEALNNWGNALLAWAEKKEDVEADALFAQAGEKYWQALTIKPDKHEALNNWGVALLTWAEKKEGAEADALFVQASEKYQQALTIKPDKHEALYNLACIAALRVETETAISMLERWRMAKHTASRSDLDNDRDFDGIRTDPRFLAFRERLP